MRACEGTMGTDGLEWCQMWAFHGHGKSFVHDQYIQHRTCGKPITYEEKTRGQTGELSCLRCHLMHTKHLNHFSYGKVMSGQNLLKV